MLTRSVGDTHSSILPPRHSGAVSESSNLPPKHPKAPSEFLCFKEGETRFLQSNALADDCRHLKRVFSMRLV